MGPFQQTASEHDHIKPDLIALMLNRLGILWQGAKGYYSWLGQYQVQLQGLWWQQWGPSSGTCITSMPFHVLSQVVRTHETTCTHAAAKLLLTSVCTLMAGEFIRTWEPAPAPIPLACKWFLSCIKNFVLEYTVIHEIPCLLWNLKAHYCVQNSTPPVPNVSHMTALYAASQCP